MEYRLYKIVKGILIVMCIVVSLMLIVFLGIKTNRLITQRQEELEALEASKAAHYAEHNQNVSSFPHRLTIYNKISYLNSIDMFELYGNHSYTGYVIITIDRTRLTDDDVYWILKGKRYEWELDATAYWWLDGTDIDLSSFSLFACRSDENNIYFIFRTDPQRQSLRGCSFSVTITYLQDGADYDDEYRYSYRADFTGSNYHNSTGFLPVETLKILADVMIDAVS